MKELQLNDVYNQLVEKTEKHKYELIFNCGPNIALLLPGIEYDGEDYYWRLFDLDTGYYLSSCVGRIDYMKGKIDEDTYNFLFNIFKINYKRVLNRMNKNLPNEIVKEIEEILK